jgi:transcriptional regulator with XRE-family HTH domain
MNLRIREVLKDRKITAVALAERIGIAQPSMSNIVNGKATPSLDTLERIAGALGVSVSELIDEPKPGNFICPNCGASLKLSAEKLEGK